MPDANSFILTPLRHAPRTPARARTCLDRLSAVVRSETVVSPATNEERIAFWRGLSDWCNQNIESIGGGAGALAHGGEGAQG